MPHIGDYGVSGFGDDRPVLGVFSTRHGIERARQRGIRPDTLRKSSQNVDCNGRRSDRRADNKRLVFFFLLLLANMIAN